MSVRDLLATMYVAGMDLNSGEFAFKVGFPAKSSLAGVVMSIVPGVMGICTLEEQPLEYVILDQSHFCVDNTRFRLKHVSSIDFFKEV